MDRLLSRDGFARALADAVGLDAAALQDPATLADPVVLLRLDDVIGTVFGVEVPEAVVTPPVTLDALYRGYVEAHVLADLDSRA
jgi:hypothetical protein